MAFSASDAAFEGFRVVRRHPVALVFWTLAYLVMMAAVFAIVGGQLGGLMSAAREVEQAGASVTPETFAPLMQSYAAIGVVLVPVSLLVSAVLAAAISRAVLYPGESAFGYIRLGADELRVLGVTVALFFVFMAVWAGIGFVLGFVHAFVAGAPGLWLLLVLLGLAGFCLMIWLAVRLSLAVPITMGERRMAVFDSFRLTKGRFWPLLGMTLLACVMALVVSILGSIIAMPIQLLTGGPAAFAHMDGENVGAILREAWPAVIAWGLINAVQAALQVAVLYAPFSAAYLALTPGAPAAVRTAG